MDLFSNEKLAVLIQQGEMKYMSQLWEQTYKFIEMRANKFYAKFHTQFGGIEIEDLIQQGYFALAQAVDYFDEKSGYSFLTYLGYTLRNSFKEVCGRHSKDGFVPDLLDLAKSLDEPLSENDDITLADTITDDDINSDVAELIFKSVYNEELRAALDEALTILKPNTKRIIELYYYAYLSQERISNLLNCSRGYVSAEIKNGLVRIYNSKHRKILKSFLPGGPIDLYATGYCSWKYSGAIEEKFLILKGDKEWIPK